MIKNSSEGGEKSLEMLKKKFEKVKNKSLNRFQNVGFRERARESFTEKNETNG